MKNLFENWRKYEKLLERINYLESGKRFVNYQLVEITKEENQLKLTEEELDTIKVWGGLTGDPDFLGSASKGQAWKFDNKVLKITSDFSEAQACNLIAGKEHPNVYRVYKVGKRSDRFEELSRLKHVIVYEYLDYPTKQMADATYTMHHRVRTGRAKSQSVVSAYHEWNENSIVQFKDLINDLIDNTAGNPEILGPEANKYQHAAYYEKVDFISDALRWSPTEKTLFNDFWMTIHGADGTKLNSPEAVYKASADLIADPRVSYFHQLALGLTFLYENGVVFSDLKTSNVMEKDSQIVIIDIGYSIVPKPKPIEEIK